MALIFKNSPYSHWEFINPDSRDCLRIVPERGGLITSWVCNGREMLYFDQSRFKDPLKSIRGGIPILFPICGNLPENKCLISNKEYVIKQHGFARDCSWDLDILEDCTGIKLTLTENDLSLSSFPFKFTFELEVRTRPNGLEIVSWIQNNSLNVMPFSFGLHPYFAVQDLSKTSIQGLPERCFDHITMTESHTIDQMNKLSKGVDFATSPSSSVFLIDQIDDIRLELSMQQPFNLNVVWTDPPRQMICLEPWTSPRNALISGDRIILLESNNSRAIKCMFQLHSTD